VGEQRYQAVMAVLSGGRTVTEVARDWDVSRQTMPAWLARYERAGMEGMGDRSHRPTRCPHQMPALVEVRVLEMRRHKPGTICSLARQARRTAIHATRPWDRTVTAQRNRKPI
jgi:transposase-like protein